MTIARCWCREVQPHHSDSARCAPMAASPSTDTIQGRCYRLRLYLGLGLGFSSAGLGLGIGLESYGLGIATASLDYISA